MPLTLTEVSERSARPDPGGPAICGDANVDGVFWPTHGGPGTVRPASRGAAPARPDPDRGSRRQGLLARLFAAVQRSKTAEAERLIAHYRRLTR